MEQLHGVITKIQIHRYWTKITRFSLKTFILRAVIKEIRKEILESLGKEEAKTVTESKYSNGSLWH